MKELNLFYPYKSNPNILKFVKCLATLSYVQKDFVEYTYNLLINHPIFPELKKPVFSYFYHNYIRSDININFPISLWNHYDFLNSEIPRTNNAIEGWHKAFAGSFGTSNYNFVLLLQKIKEEE